MHVLILRLDSIKFICSLSNKWSACTKLINPQTTRLRKVGGGSSGSVKGRLKSH